MTDHSSKVGRWAWIAALIVGGGTLFLAWDRFGFGGNSVAAGGRGVVDAMVAASPTKWTLNDENDPMTDEQIVSAHRQIDANGFLIDTTIACRVASGVLTYTFTTFASDGTTPADFRESVGNNLSIYHSAMFRADAGEAIHSVEANPRYSNTFEIGDGDRKLRSAKHLTVKLALGQGEPVFEIDQQADKTLANLLEQCTRAAVANEKQQQVERDKTINDLTAQYNALDAIPAAAITDEQRDRMMAIRWKLISLTGKEIPWPKAREDAENQRAAEKLQDEERASQQGAQAAAYEENKAAEHSRLCASIQSTGAGNEDYRKAMGC